MPTNPTTTRAPEGLDIIEQHRKLVDSLHKNAAAVVPVERVMAFVHAVTSLVLEVVPDVRLKTLFLETPAAADGAPAGCADGAVREAHDRPTPDDGGTGGAVPMVLYLVKDGVVQS